MKKIIVVGGGAAGFFFAVNYKEKNPKDEVIILEKAKLPMYGTIESLNVSVACGAFLYEVVRQRLL